jgi:serine/threonine protein kinase
MRPEQWQSVKDKIESLLEVDAAERSVYLDQIAGSDGELRRELESLLMSKENMATDFLEVPAYSEPGTLLSTSSIIGRRLGPYQIVAEIGQGGMGEVYRALRVDDQYEKQVAIKLIRAGRESEFVITRFKNERQILAKLEHPNIARLLDGGSTPEGVPYLVMELIEGESIIQYCDRRALGIIARLELFLHVCSAVQFAHQRLIIHRDIKPGNILVTAERIPKLLDFGISKILDAESDSGGGDHTTTILRMLTPAYASPEQIKGEAITTASDVYSLGVVLYELFTGRHPYRSDGSSEQMLRAICESEPEKPSTAVKTTGERTRSGSLGSSPAGPIGTGDKLSKRLRGDLDNIVLMALRKEPQRRYASADQFAEDIRRYLGNLPVIARKDTASYRASKFVLRHKAGVVAAGIVILTLLAAFVAVVREERIAKRRFNDVRALANSLIFDVHDSIKDLPGSTPARKVIVDRALQYLNSLAAESSNDLGLQRELATAYERVGLVQGHYLQDSLGDTKGSLDSYQKALKLRQQIDAKSGGWKDHLAVAQGYRLVANLLVAIGKRNQARENIDRAIAISYALNTKQPNQFEILHELGFDYEVSDYIGYPDDPNDASKVLDDAHKAVDADEAALKIKPNDLKELDGYAIDLSHVGGHLEGSDPRKAIEYYEKELEIELRLTQRSNNIKYSETLAVAYRDIGSVYDDLGEYPRSLENYVKCVTILEQLNRTDPQNATIRQSLAIEYANEAGELARVGKAKLGIRQWNKSTEIMRSLVASSPETAPYRHYLAAIVAMGGSIFTRARNPDAAFKQFEEARSIYQSASDTTRLAACSEKMGENAALAGDLKTAEDNYHQALAIVEPLIAIKLPKIDALYTAADAYSGLGDLSLMEAKTSAQSTSRRKSRSEACLWYGKSVAAWQQIEHPSRSTPNGFDAGDPAAVAKKLQQCQAGLSHN